MPPGPTQRDQWLAQQLRQLGLSARDRPQALTAEASMRRYWRVPTNRQSVVLMDAPPATENNRAFVAMAGWLRSCGLQAPAILASDLEHGWLLLQDLGDRQLYHALLSADPTARRRHYETALGTLVTLQRASLEAPPAHAPTFDLARLERELGLFEHWFLERLLGIGAPAAYAEVRQALMNNALEQPRVGVYLDYHARNLMLQDDDSLGLVDFQDFCMGPLAYDAVSLIRDCYLRWSAAEQQALLDAYRRAASELDIPGSTDPRLPRWFDLCGIQRHLKVLGIFSRLFLEHGRRDYLADLPRVLAHLDDTLALQPASRPLADWFATTVVPAARIRLQQEGAWPTQ